MPDVTDFRVVTTPNSGHTEATSAQALADILIWSKNCPGWQRDALRRLCLKGELDQKDIEELTALCKAKGKDVVALATEHIPDPNVVATTIHLRGIHSVKNVNALKEGERLTFDKSGLTVVYGDNGSGKSGYARILKKACRARNPKNDSVLPNIYGNQADPQKAIIDFSACDQNRSENWTAKGITNPLLSSISVFDSRTANIHVDAVNDVAYTPFPMKVLERLADACQEVKKRLSSEIQEIERQTPSVIAVPKCGANTTVGMLLSNLSGSTSDKSVRDLARLTDSEKTRIATLRTDLGDDPEKTARKVEALKTRLIEGAKAVEGMVACTAGHLDEQLITLHQNFELARSAAMSAADSLFNQEPLSNVGSDVWRALWEAARSYSQQQAYPNIPFPAVGDEARCVLCHQGLGMEAVDRFVRFERFVQDVTKKKEADARVAYQRARDGIEHARVPSDKMRSLVALIRDELGDAPLAVIVRKVGIGAKWRLRAILRNHAVARTTAVFAGTTQWPSVSLSDHVTSLMHRVTILRADGSSSERKQMQQEYAELVDREWLAGVQDDAIAEIARRKARTMLNQLVKDASTTRITAKSSEIAERLVTNTLRARFLREIDRLGMAGLAIELRKDKSTYGVPRFRVSLIRKPDAAVGEVLSEGEHRCVALAAFLTELAINAGNSAIVFDDPVSSLDHLHREAVVSRIVEEGLHRQVVVFTHDIAFLFLLDQQCREKGTSISFRCVTRSDDYAGFCQQDPPARAQPIDKVIEGMKRQLDNEKVLYERGDHARWERTVDSLQKRLRTTWERAVEEAIAPVFKRLSNKVDTKGLAKLTTLTMDDCIKMRLAYGRCSNLLHSSADVLNPPLPNPSVIENEIAALREWMADVRSRQDQVAFLN
jgi:energy-coupling factor transporter ATP-binding protein EcfA2